MPHGDEPKGALWLPGLGASRTAMGFPMAAMGSDIGITRVGRPTVGVSKSTVHREVSTCRRSCSSSPAPTV
ncbi:predicted protein [Streptomyces viridosporus ATCC 14672]|uniref:Predicted protein n=1 Tax=Streptomyces viridosporus (strain ATCC 14672 / DSM 40746 / JCM 4963 / KCTC 9882 / NRRL B-12104 / FH 1290) TaxID=566461 RepID=D5ZYL2_STRV1|nr:predicted protein [Streptomyces viridosporus ATCC 14672]